MTYILVAIIAWILYGILSILDKFLLDHPIKSASAYTFYTGAFSIFAFLIFLPFARFSGTSHFAFDLLCGLIFLAGQYFVFESLVRGEVSVMVPISGAFTPIFSLLVVNYGLHLHLTTIQFFAFVLLVTGTVFISFHKGKIDKAIIFPIASSIFFALYYSLVKLAYTPFEANFSFVRLGSLIGSLLMLFIPSVRHSAFAIADAVKKKTSALFVSKEIVAGLGFIVLNYAVSIGNPALINAMQGFEYVVIFILAAGLAKAYPGIIKEDTGKRALFRKFAAVILLFAGVFLLEYVK